ncbi:hypothetical protein C8R42DRAFT_220229 [Lentinula raphanica]|nr:hypothetical protein C8R42DRAFT_220229 [Lentinula raphanica]
MPTQLPSPDEYSRAITNRMALLPPIGKVRFCEETYQELLLRCRNNNILDLELNCESQLPLSPVESTKPSNDNDAMLLEKISACQSSLLSPIRRLPPEILSEVFAIAARGSIAFGIPGYSTKLSGPVSKLRLTWVCMWWRTQALSQPELWSSMHVWLIDTASGGRSEVGRIMKECISRSGPIAPLDISITVINTPTQARTPINHEGLNVLDMLLDHLRRWKDVSILVSRYEGMKYIHDMMVEKQNSLNPDAEFPEEPFKETMIHSLQLRLIPSVPDMMPARPLAHNLLCCPSLHTLHISHLWDTDPMDLGNLTVLNISHSYFGSSFATLLQNFPSLQSFSVSKYAPNPNIDPTISSSYRDLPKVHHTSLRVLEQEIIGQEDFAPTDIWESVWLPNLTTLRVKTFAGFETANSWKALRHLKNMIMRSDCALNTVTLKGLWSSHSIVVSFFDGLPVQSTSHSLFVNDQPYRRT